MAPREHFRSGQHSGSGNESRVVYGRDWGIESGEGRSIEIAAKDEAVWFVQAVFIPGRDWGGGSASRSIRFTHMGKHANSAGTRRFMKKLDGWRTNRHCLNHVVRVGVEGFESMPPHKAGFEKVSDVIILRLASKATWMRPRITELQSFIRKRFEALGRTGAKRRQRYHDPIRFAGDHATPPTEHDRDAGGAKFRFRGAPGFTDLDRAFFPDRGQRTLTGTSNFSQYPTAGLS